MSVRQLRPAFRILQSLQVLTALLLTTAGVAVVPPAVVHAADPVKPLAAQHYRPVPIAKPRLANTALTVDAAAVAVKHQRPAPVWPATATADAVVPAAGKAVSPPRVRAGTLPVLVATAGGAGRKVRISTFDRATARRLGVDGLLLRVGAVTASQPSPVEITVEYAKFATAYGADWASRLRLVALPGCTPTSICTPVVLTTRNDVHAQSATAKVQAVTASGTLVALTAGPSGGAGSFTASDLKPSSTWAQSGSTGDFTWSYPMLTPAPAGGPAPQVALSYSAQSVDGRTAASNNQPGPIGEGFDIGQAYIERRYVTCADDMAGSGANNTTKTGDLCWKTDNAVLSMQGHAGELIKDGDGLWHTTANDGSKIERMTNLATGNGAKDNEYWKVTTADGTQYWFGRHQLPGWSSGKPVTNSVWTVPVFGNNTGEPCHQTTFAASSCTQAWRWNLDYVVDVNSNTMSYWYIRDTNKYAKNTATTAPTDYTRGGYLTRIDYGTDNRDGTEYTSTSPYTNAPDQVIFTNTDRCDSNCTTKTEDTWPDTPWDLDCTVAPKTTNCLQGAPTFWTSKRITQITTQVSGSPIDSWVLGQGWPNPGDGTRKGLWLQSITYSGRNGGTVSYPSVSFSGIQMPNRVDSSGGDWALAMNWWRVNSIRNETGGETFITYSPRECVAGSKVPAAADANTLRCYPVKWTPPGYTNDVTDYFHKYVVTDVQQIDHAGGNKTQLTHYDYKNPQSLPLWHHDDDDGLVPAGKKSWAQWRGYPTVVTTVGDASEQTKTETLYYRGMHGDLLANGDHRSTTITDRDGGTAIDYPAFAGQPREQITWNGAVIAESTVTDLWQSAPTATRTIGTDTVESRYVNEGTVRTRVALDGGGWQRTKTVASYDKYGAITELADLGDEATTSDDRCTTTEYARNTNAPKWLLTPVKRISTWAGSCNTEPITIGQILSDTRYSFDDAVFGSTPAKGQVTATESISDFDSTSGLRAYHLDGTTAYDPQGRVTDLTDVSGAKTHTAYTPTSGGPTTHKKVTTALSWSTDTDFDARGMPTKVIDTNGRVTEAAYDAAGRVVSVWSPGRPRATYGTSPSSSYAYTLIKADGNTITDATVVTSGTLNANGNYDTTYTLYDGFVRARQTQDTAHGGPAPTEKIVSDTFYDSAGRLWKTNDPHPMPGLPTGKIADGLSADVDIPRQTINRYDAAGRLTDVIQMSEDIEKWRSTTSYHGDHVDDTAPEGGTGTSTFTDARDRPVAVREYHGRVPAGAYDETTTHYNLAGRVDRIVDPSGNNWTFTYDVRGRPTRATDPDHGLTVSGYNDKDQLESVTDAENQTLAYTYDAIGRKTSVRDGTTAGAVRADWTYDTPVKGVTGTSTRYITNVDGTISAYASTLVSVDAEYRPRQTRVTIPASEGTLTGTYNTSFTYKADGSPATITLPAAGGLAQETLTYDYDSTYALPADLKTNYAGAAYYINQATYTNLNEPSSITRSTQLSGAGFVSTNREYDKSTGRIDHRAIIRSIGTAYISNAEIGYDATGNITKVDDDAASGRDTQCFQYDYLRRLTEAWTPATADCGSIPTSATDLGGPAPYWQSWQFGTPDDPVGRVGNRLKQINHAAAGDVTTDYTYPAATAAQPHAVTSTTTSGDNGTTTNTYSYYRNGNTKTRPGPNGQQTLDWDPEGKLAKVTDPAASSSYLYDADGNRLITRDSTGTILDLGHTQLRLAAGATTASATRYYTFNGEIIGQRDNIGLRWLAADHQGTNLASVTADTNQALTQRRQTPYGETRGPTTTWVNPKGFLNGQTDPTGLTHLGAREYDPSLGKFVSVDPIQDIADPQQWNAYSYASNSPITKADPSGLKAWEDDFRSKSAENSHYRPGKTGRTFLEWYRDNLSKKTKEKASGSANPEDHHGTLRKKGSTTLAGSITIYDRYGNQVFSDDLVRSGGGSLYYEDIPQFDAHVETRASQFAQDEGLIHAGDTIVINLDKSKKVCGNCKPVMEGDADALGAKFVVKSPGMKPEVFGEKYANVPLKSKPRMPNSPRLAPDSPPEVMQRSNGKPMLEGPEPGAGRVRSRTGGRAAGGAGAVEAGADIYFLLRYGPCGLGFPGLEQYCQPPNDDPRRLTA